MGVVTVRRRVVERGSMRRLLPLLLAVLSVVVVPAATGAMRARAHEQPSAGLRLNHVQARGTHNSYHRDPGTAFGDQVGWDYSHKTLARQLEEQDVRQLELDVHWNWARQEFEVYHAWFGDDRSTCELLTDCLAEVRWWSDRRPDHHPIVILIEPKDGGPPKNAGLPEDADPFTHPIGEDEYQLLDRILLDAFAESTAPGDDRVLTPAEVTVQGKTLRQSILDHGWPLLDDLRGHVLYVVDGRASREGERPTTYQHAYDYSGGWTTLEGRAAFVQAEPEQAVAAFVSRDGERLHGEEDRWERISRVVEQGFLVRDLGGDHAFYERSKAAGSHFISTDHPGDLELSPHPGAPSRCNPVTAPRGCTDPRLELRGQGPLALPDEPDDGPEGPDGRALRLVESWTTSASALVERNGG